MAYDNSIFAANVRAERARKKMTREEVALRTGLSAAVIQNYENGTCVPGVDKLWLLSNLFDTTPSDLIGWQAN